MANLKGFDARTVEPATGFEPVPAGTYTAIIAGTAMKPTKAGTGSYLEIGFQIIEGEHKGRGLWTRLNLDNPNATAVKMAMSELSSICRAVGVMQPRDSAELHNLPLAVTVRLRKREDTGELTNEIKGYERKASAGQAQTAPATDNTPPWKR